MEFRHFVKEKVFGNILWSIHATKTISNSKPNACVLFHENSRGHFEQYTLCDDSLSKDDDTQKRCDFNFIYCHPFVEQPYQNVNVGGRKRVRTNDLTCKIKILQNKPQKSMLEIFLLLVTQKEWQNSVYISHQAQRVNLPSILETFLSIGIIPNVIRKETSLHSLEIEILNCRFLNGSSF